MSKEIYLDNAAATAIAPRAQRAMVRALRVYGNPSSYNNAGRSARAQLARAREGVARFLNCRPSEVVFCASGSEANALALAHRREILTQPTEHQSVLAAAGKHARMLSVDAQGLVHPEELVRMLHRSTEVVSVMYANNEVGAVQPIKKIAAAIRAWRRKHQTALPYLHVDACQATAWLPMDVQALGADLVTLNGAKAYGPHGTAVLYVRRGVPVYSQVLGGDQEGGRRAGTEDVAGATGLAEALATIRPADALRVSRLRDHAIAGICAAFPDARLNGPNDRERLANNINISVLGASSEDLLLELDAHGIRAGAGSACTAHAVEPSHVLVAMGVPRKYLGGALRFSLSRHTTRAEVDALIRVLPRVVATARSRTLK
jgi:cysteine desulfurase